MRNFRVLSLEKKSEFQCGLIPYYKESNNHAGIEVRLLSPKCANKHQKYAYNSKFISMKCMSGISLF